MVMTSLYIWLLVWDPTHKIIRVNIIFIFYKNLNNIIFIYLLHFIVYSIKVDGIDRI